MQHLIVMSFELKLEFKQILINIYIFSSKKELLYMYENFM